MITQAAPLGFSFTNLVKTVAHDTVRVVSDPRAQQLVAAAGQAYAPGATAQVAQVAHTVQHDIRKARKFWYGGKTIVVQPGAAPPAGATPVDDNTPPPDDTSEAPGAQLPVQNSHMLVYGGIAAGVLLLLLIAKR